MLVAATAVVTSVLAGRGGEERELLPLTVEGFGFPPQCCPELVENAAGQAAIVWEEHEGRDAGLRVAFMPNDDWGPPIRVPGAPRSRRQGGQAMLADGRAVVVWEGGDRGTEGTLRAAVVGPDREVQTATLFRRTAGAHLGHLVPVAARGRRALAAWEWTDSAGGHVDLARWDGAGWTVDALREDPGRRPGRAFVAIDAVGNALAVWWRDPYGSLGSVARPVEASYRTAGGAWSRPRTVARLRPDDVDVLTGPAATFAGRGRPVVTWASRWRGVPVRLYARTLAGGRWRSVAPPRTPRGVLRFDRRSRTAALAVVTRGGAVQQGSDAPAYARIVTAGESVVLVWATAPRDSLDVQPREVYYSVLEHDGFSGPFGVPNIRNTSDPSAVMRPDGRLLVAYAGERGVFTVTLDPELGWVAPTSVAP